MVAANRTLPPGQEIVVYKNNSDRKATNSGTYENPPMDRATCLRSCCRRRDAALHHAPDLLRRRQGRLRGERRAGRRGAVPAHAASRLLRGGGRPRDHVEASDRQHARRAARRRAEVPPAARDRRRREPLRDRHVLEARHHRPGAVDDRRRVPAAEFVFAAPVQALRRVSYDLSCAARSS